MLKKISLSAMVFTYLFAGLAHFIRFDYYLSIEPSFMPFPEAMVRFSGACLLLMGVFLAHPRTRKAACTCVIFYWALGLPLNLYVLSLGGAGIPLSQGTLIGRIPFHIGLMAWAWWHRLPDKPSSPPNPSARQDLEK